VYADKRERVDVQAIEEKSGALLKVSEAGQTLVEVATILLLLVVMGLCAFGAWVAFA
jgi:hypothetical protein